MKYSASLVAIALALSGLVACASDSGGPGAETVDQTSNLDVVHAELNGIWRSHCDAGEATSRRREVSFCNGEALFIEYGYADADCGSLSSTFSFEAAIEDGSDPATDGSRLVRQTLLAFTITALDEPAAEHFSTLDLCGNSQWSPGMSLEMMGCLDEDEASITDVESRYRVESTQLSMSVASDNRAVQLVADVDTQPTRLSEGVPTVYFRRPMPDGFCGE